MADESDFEIPITADVSDAVSGFKQVEESAHEMGEAVKESGEGGGEALKELKESIEGGVENIQRFAQGLSGLARIGGLAAVGEVIAKIGETLTEASTEMQMFASRTQMSLEESHEFMSSMEMLGVPTQAVSMAMRKLSSDIATGGKHLAELGISATTAAGESKSLAEVYEETTEKLASYGNNAKEAADANDLLGRSGQVLVQTHQVQKEIMEELGTVSRATGLDVQALTNAGNQQRYMEVLLNDTWQAFATTVAPLVVGGMNIVVSVCLGLQDVIQSLVRAVGVLIDALEALAKSASQVFSALATNLSQIGNLMKDALTFNFTGLQGDLKGVSDSTMALGDTVLHLGDNFKETGDAWNKMLADNKAQSDATTKAIDDMWNGTYKKIAQDQAKAMSAGVSGGGAPDLSGTGKGKKAPDMSNLDQALMSSSDKMDQLNKKFQQLGSEASMVAKEGGKSFDQLRAQAVTDYQDMQTKYQQFQDAVESGSKKAAMQAEKAWHESATKFEQDWKLASEKAKQDMQAITKTADQISSEISGVLNSAISGRLNWAQEFQKILSKMVDLLVKHLTQQVALWIAHEAQVNAVKATGGAQGLAIQKTQNTVAGTSDAVTAAKGAYASAAQIPYIGWILAPAAAAAAFIGVEAFGSAAGGYDIPMGVNPITQLHAKEMVLPAHLAEGVRNMSGQGGGGQRNTTNHTWNVNALDGKSVVDMLKSNSTVLAAIGAAHERSGGRHYTG